jgi:hypothetical protein
MTGERPQPRRGERITAALVRPLATLLVGGLRKYRPIDGPAVAEAMVRVALENPPAPQTPSTTVHESDAIAARAR